MLHGLDEGMHCTQARVADFGGLGVEGRSRVADLHISDFLFSPSLVEVAFFTKDL